MRESHSNKGLKVTAAHEVILYFCGILTSTSSFTQDYPSWYRTLKRALHLFILAFWWLLLLKPYFAYRPGLDVRSEPSLLFTSHHELEHRQQQQPPQVQQASIRGCSNNSASHKRSRASDSATGGRNGRNRNHDTSGAPKSTKNAWQGSGRRWSNEWPVGCVWKSSRTAFLVGLSSLTIAKMVDEMPRQSLEMRRDKWRTQRNVKHTWWYGTKSTTVY